MSFEFNENLIDLVELGKRNPKVVASRPFGWHIVGVADGVVWRYDSLRTVAGIRRCLRHELGVLQWKTRFGFIPLATWRFIDTSFCDAGSEFVMPDSIIATALYYRDALNERDTGLREIILSEFVTGLEWACKLSLRISKFEAAPTTPRIRRTDVVKYLQ